MINSDRIVPVTKTDLLTLYGNILKIAGTEITALTTETTDGTFAITEDGTVIANEPVKSCSVVAGTYATMYFIPTYDYEGFTIAGAPVTTTGDTVDPDGATLYTATIGDDNSITIAKVGF